MSQAEPVSDARGGGDGGDDSAIWRLVLVAAVLLAAALLVHLTPVRAYVADARRVRGELLSLGIWVYPVAVVAVALLLGCGVPRLPLHAAGGMIFGFALGLVLTLLGAVLGHYCVFLFIRWGGRDWARCRWPALRRWSDALRDHGVVGVLLARQLPAHAMVINAALAISHVRQRDFLSGTALGLLPEAVPATLIGAGLMRGSLKGSSSYLALAAAAFALVWIAGACGLRALRKPRPAPAAKESST